VAAPARIAAGRVGPRRAAGLVGTVLAVIVGSAVVGGTASPSVPSHGRGAPPVAFASQPSPRAVPSPTADPATFEGASALAGDAFVIPPPRWLAGRRAVAVIGLVTSRVRGLGYRTDPYEK